MNILLAAISIPQWEKWLGLTKWSEFMMEKIST
jgi:hypothetical protein